MALDTYANLKTAILNWMARSELTGEVTDWITLAEGHLNRELGQGNEVEATLAGVSGSRDIDVSSLSIISVKSLWVVDSSTGDEREIMKDDDGSFAYIDDEDEPTRWAYDKDSEKINFDVKCDDNYSFRLVYRGRIALSNGVTSNWLLEEHPDVYFASSLVWGCAFVGQPEKASGYKSLMDEGIANIKSVLAESRKTQLEVDPAILAVGSARGGWDGNFA